MVNFDLEYRIKVCQERVEQSTDYLEREYFLKRLNHLENLYKSLAD